jgi:hypothetical protein
MADRGDPRSSRAWKTLRASWAAVIATSIVTCPRCGKHITSDQPWDLGHRTALRSGGSNGDAWPEHRGCNRRAGGELSVEVRRANRGRRADRGRHVYPPPSRDW